MKKTTKQEVAAKAEAVAAKLSDRIECPNCLGAGMLYDVWYMKNVECSRCGGKKWVRPNLEKFKDE